jgi:AAA15 family ATPase/GTPase
MQTIKHLRIKNFKSIKELIIDCKRINVFIGEPNVGKSNILEALDLFYLPAMIERNYPLKGETGDQAIRIQDFFRIDEVDNLFYRGEIKNPIEISFTWEGSNKLNILSLDFIKEDQARGWNNKLSSKNFFRLKIEGFTIDFTFDFIPLAESDHQRTPTPIIPFKYKEDIHYNNNSDYRYELLPPYGSNLPQVIDHIPNLEKFIIEEMSKLSDIEFAINKKESRLLQQIRIDRGLVYSLPYKSIADTTKRLIFYLAAIQSPSFDVITLEEPEAHSFPPYVSMMADEIIKASSKQFFIATHSSVLLTNLIENTPKDELSVFACYYNKDRKSTDVKSLSQDDLSELLNYGVDVFFNINRYLDDRIEHSA